MFRRDAEVEDKKALLKYAAAAAALLYKRAHGLIWRGREHGPRQRTSLASAMLLTAETGTPLSTSSSSHSRVVFCLKRVFNFTSSSALCAIRPSLSLNLGSCSFQHELRGIDS